MGIEGVKEVVSSLFDCAPALRPDHGAVEMARADQVKAGRRAAAKRLGLDLSEHAITVVWSGRQWAG